MVIKKVLGSSIALVFVLAALCSGVGSGLAQRKPVTKPGPPADVLSYLPPSDGLALVDVLRLMNETLPRIMAVDPAKLLIANAEIEKFITRTGIVPRYLDHYVL